jgi:hypothetical protein
MDREQLLAAMYNDPDPVAKATPIEQTGLRSRKIRVGIVEYEVPTVEYVQQLERLVTQQADLLTQHRRTIDRVTAMLYGTRNFVRRQAESLRNDTRKPAHDL